MGTYDSMLRPLGWRSSTSSHCGNVSHVHGSDASMQALGIASTRVSDDMRYSRISGRAGANPKPQLPMATDVTPCQPDSVQYGSQNTWAS